MWRRKCSIYCPHRKLWHFCGSTLSTIPCKTQQIKRIDLSIRARILLSVLLFSMAYILLPLSSSPDYESEGREFESLRARHSFDFAPLEDQIKRFSVFRYLQNASAR